MYLNGRPHIFFNAAGPCTQLSAKEHKQQAQFHKSGESIGEKKFLTKLGKSDIDGALTGYCLTGGKPGGSKG